MSQSTRRPKRSAAKKGKSEKTSNTKSTSSKKCASSKCKAEPELKPAKLEEPEPNGKDPWCHYCGNGGNLMECEHCPNAVCDLCIPQLKQLSKDELQNCTFKCSECQNKSKENKDETGFIGIYKPNGDCWFNDPLVVVSQEYTLTYQRFQIQPLLILNFHLDAFADLGTALQMAYHLLLGVYGKHQHKVVYKDIPFDLAEDSKRNFYELKTLPNILKTIQSEQWGHVLIFLTTHSDDDRGDLWFGQDAAAPICQFFPVVIGEHVLNAICNIQTLSFVFACGALVRCQESLNDLQDVSKIYNIDNLFAFSAIHLSPIQTYPFVHRYLVQAVLSGRTRETSFEWLLSETSDFGQHTNLIIIKPNSAK
ncbi:hypothetical protein ABKN59_011761 [Abortiporus biennis]